MNKKHDKNGISLLILVVSIAIILIISSVAIVNTNKSLKDAKMSSFSEELATIEDQVKIYYVKNNEMPTVNGTNVMSEQEMINLAALDSSSMTSLQNELSLNGDQSNDTNSGEFYQIDLNKLDLDNVKKGTKQSSQNDVYVASYPSMNIYYLKGEKIGSELYFSLSSRITGVVSLDKILKDTSFTTIQKVNGLIVKSDIKTWNSKMGITIQALIESDEKLLIGLSGVDGQKEVSTNIGLNTFNFNSIDDIKSVVTLTNDEITSFNNYSDSKYIDIIKKKNGVNIGVIRIDLSKYDNEKPKITENLSVEAREQENVGYFKVSDTGGSGIKEVRYDFLTRFDNNGNIVPYYENITSFDTSYLRNQGKKVIPASDGSAQVVLPKDVQSIQILVQDNAGNSEIFTQITRPDVYVGIVPKNMNDTNATFDLVVDSLNGISLVNTYMSLDGVTYSNLQDYTSSNSNKLVIKCDRYTTISTDKSYIYIKAIVKDANVDTSKRKTEVRVLRIDRSQGIVSKVNAPKILQGMTPIKFDTSGNVVDTTSSDLDWYSYVDTTYSASISNWANARTVDGSEWVWIPRYAYRIVNGYHSSNKGIIEIKFLDGATNNFIDGSGQAVSDPDKITYNGSTQNEFLVHPAFANNVNNGGWDSELTGMWVAKYEAGYEEPGNAIDSNVTYSGDSNTYLSTGNFGGAKNYYGNITSGTTKIKYPVFKANRYSYSAINISSAYSISKALGDTANPYGITPSLNPHLMKTTEYGAISYLTYSKYGINRKDITVNSTNANISAQAIHAITAGGNGTNAKALNEATAITNNKLQSSTGNIYGIYDLSGGLWEEQASYISNYNSSFSTYAINMLNDGGATTSIKYKLVYSNGYSSKIKGDGIYETSSSSTTDTDSNNSWNKNYSVFPYNAYPLFYLSGKYSNGTSAGIFTYHHDTGLSSYGTGFRVALSPT